MVSIFNRYFGGPVAVQPPAAGYYGSIGPVTVRPPVVLNGGPVFPAGPSPLLGPGTQSGLASPTPAAVVAEAGRPQVASVQQSIVQDFKNHWIIFTGVIALIVFWHFRKSKKGHK